MSEHVTINIAGEAAVIGPDDVLVISVSEKVTTVENIEAISDMLRARLGERFVVLVGPQTVTAQRGGTP